MNTLYSITKVNKNKIVFSEKNHLKAHINQSINLLKVGQIIKITSIILDNKKLRKISFIGRCISFKKCANNSFITLRNNFKGIGIENTFLIYSPSIIYLQILPTPHKKFKRAKLYFLQNKSNKVNTIKLV